MDAGGSYVLCDTDSMAIVASEQGGLVPCAGGSYRDDRMRECVRALSWAEVDEIVRKFSLLNPYDGSSMPASILKVEDVNFRNGAQREIHGYAIAAKRYALFTDNSGDIEIVSAKAHGLGFLLAPDGGGRSPDGTPDWVVDSWKWILRGVLGMKNLDPEWFDRAAMMRLKITTPEVLKALQARQSGMPYRDRVKPFNFILSPIIDDIVGRPIGVKKSDPFTLIAPFMTDPARWYRQQYLNIHDGKSYRVSPPNRQRPSEARAKSCGDFVSEYRWHPEAKSLGPDGQICTEMTNGLLKRTPVSATAKDFCYIGKEADRRWEQGEDISILQPEVVQYRPDETARLVADPLLPGELRRTSIRRLAKESGVSPNTIKRARRGERIQKAIAAKLVEALARIVESDLMRGSQNR